MIKPAVILASLMLSAACQSPAAQAQAETETITEEPAIWRQVSPENLLLINTIHGQTVVELNPDFAPDHVAQVRALASDGVYDGQRFYRVIDAFVAQGGLEDEDLIETYPTLVNENDRPLSEAGFVPLGNGDMFAPEIGHIDGFPVGRSEEIGREWLLHCPGAMAMARDTDPDSGGTEFYIVLDAQRYLDRNLTVFGRVISGMQYIQKLKRGDRAIESGVIQAPDQGDEILSMQIAADLPETGRPAYRVMISDSPAFEDAKTQKRVRGNEFFYRTPPEVLDICGFEPPVERISELVALRP